MPNTTEWDPTLKASMGEWRVYFASKCSLLQQSALRWYLKPVAPDRPSWVSEPPCITQLKGIKLIMEDKHRVKHTRAYKDSTAQQKPVKVQAWTQLSNNNLLIKSTCCSKYSIFHMRTNYFKKVNFPANHWVSHINYQQSQCTMYAACNTIPWTNAFDACGSCKTYGSMKI